MSWIRLLEKSLSEKETGFKRWKTQEGKQQVMHYLKDSKCALGLYCKDSDLICSLNSLFPFYT